MVDYQTDQQDELLKLIDEGKLLNLIKDNSIMQAPATTQRSGEWHEIIITIGDDHVAYITLDDDALKELYKRNTYFFKQSFKQRKKYESI